MDISWILIPVIIIILSFAGFIFYLWVNKLKRERIRHEEFTRQLINSQERERKRLAAELHDGMGQNLLVIKNNALMLLKNPDMPEAFKENLNAISEITSSTLNDVRSISHNLRPAELDRFGLTEAINSAVEKIQNSVEFNLKTRIDNIDSLFENEVEINIYRIVQESLNNVIKYSEASESELIITKDKSDIKITLTDNGKGFDVNNPSKLAGSGIRAITERVNILNGLFDIASSPGKGTKIFITIPLNSTGFKLSKRTFKSSAQKSGDLKTNNLPSQIKSFIGREKELFEIKSRIKETNLLTIIGSGGTGKTSLAIQTGYDLLDEFDDGVWLVELAPVIDSSLIPQTIASVFGLKESGKLKIDDILADYIKNKKLLLIIDNCEHLLEGSSKIIKQLLQNCQNLKVLSTSREPLKITNETTYRVPPLPYPEIKKRYKAKDLVKFDSVLLFYDRAVKVREDFSITDSNTSSIAFICNKLDGIPLALELAAARTDILTAENIAERLNDRFHLLKGKDNKILPRQKTLQAMIDWSYNLLNEKEKTLLCSLSVFSGGWKLDAAEEICSNDDIRKPDILDLLDSLINKSLIVFDGDNYRYNILETIKEYGREKLENENEISSRHLDYFLELSEKAGPELQKENIKFWVDIIEAEHNNFLSAIDWSLNNENAEKGAIVASALREFWDIRGLYSTGIRFIENILQSSVGLQRFLKAKVLWAIGVYKWRQQEYEQAKKYYEESLGIRKEIGDKNGIAGSMNSLGVIAAEKGDYEQAKKYYEESLGIAKEIGDKNGIASFMNNLGIIATNQGEFEQAKKYLEECLDIQKEIGAKRRIAYCLINLGILVSSQGDYEQAKKYYEESLDIRKEIGDKKGIAESLSGLGSVLANQGDYDIAKKYLEECLDIQKEIGDKRGIAYAFGTLGLVTSNQGDFEQAKKFFEEGLTIRKGIGDKRGIAESLSGLGSVLANQGDFESAVKLLSASEKIMGSIGGVLGNTDQKRKEVATTNLHEQLSEEEFNKYWDEGQKLTLEEAVALALKKE